MNYKGYINTTDEKIYGIIKERSIEIFNFENQPNITYIEEYKKYLQCDEIFQTQNSLIFCQLIDDIEILEDI
jgi:hypothetical protein